MGSSVSLTACRAWMLAEPSARMVLKIGFRVLKTSSLSMPEPSWIHSRQASEAAARCSSPLPAGGGRGVWAAILKVEPGCICNVNRRARRTFLEAALYAVRDSHPPLRDELIQDACGKSCLQSVKGSLSGLGTEEQRLKLALAAKHHVESV